jgi:hypothetical protein
MACELPICNMRMRYFTPTHRCLVRKPSTQAVVYIHICSFISTKYKHMCIHSILVSTYERLDRQYRCVTVDDGHITYGRTVQLNARKKSKKIRTPMSIQAKNLNSSGHVPPQKVAQFTSHRFLYHSHSSY